jgi:hypothetical protein
MALRHINSQNQPPQQSIRESLEPLVLVSFYGNTGTWNVKNGLRIESMVGNNRSGTKFKFWGSSLAIPEENVSSGIEAIKCATTNNDHHCCVVSSKNKYFTFFGLVHLSTTQQHRALIGTVLDCVWPTHMYLQRLERVQGAVLIILVGLVLALTTKGAQWVTWSDSM